MSAKFLATIALAAFGLTGLSQTNKPDVHDATASTAPSRPAIGAFNGRTLFLRNCAHCHGATGRGDEGPDLHNLEFTDAWIANRIRKGKAGQMTAFGGKLRPAEIDALVAYVRTLK
jgi:mono/diheme cytochrome c family protein